MKTFGELANAWVSRLEVYEPGLPIEELARQLGLRDARRIVKLASNENPLGPSPAAVRAMRRAAAQMHRYPDGGAFYLGRALARRLRVAPDQLIVGCGSNEILELIGHVFLDAGCSVVISEHAFVVYRMVAEMFRARPIVVPMRNFTHDLGAMLAAMEADTRVVFIGNPNNPTGTMVRPADLDRFVRAVPEHVITVLDEAYVELVPAALRPDALRYVREGRKVIVLRTFSKTYGLAGVRLGYGVAPSEAIALLQRVRQPFNTTAMAQAAALAALDDAAHVRRTRRVVQSGLRCLAAGCRRLGLEYVPAVANFMLVKVGDGRRVFEALCRRGVIVRPMDGYGLPQYVRVTVGTPRENRRFLAALAQVLGTGKA